MQKWLNYIQINENIKRHGFSKSAGSLHAMGSCQVSAGIKVSSILVSWQIIWNIPTEIKHTFGKYMVSKNMYIFSLNSKETGFMVSISLMLSLHYGDLKEVYWLAGERTWGSDSTSLWDSIFVFAVTTHLCKTLFQIPGWEQLLKHVDMVPLTIRGPATWELCEDLPFIGYCSNITISRTVGVSCSYSNTVMINLSCIQ